MLKPLGLIVVGFLLWWASGLLTEHFLNRSGLGAEDFDAVAGHGIVPGWVSLVNLLGWLGLAVGGVWLVISFF